MLLSVPRKRLSISLSRKPDASSFVYLVAFYLFLTSAPWVVGLATTGEHGILLFAWEVSALFITLGLSWALYRFSVSPSPRLLGITAIYILVQILISTAYALDYSSLSLSLANQILGVIYLFIFFGIFGSVKLSPLLFYAINRVILTFIVVACIYNFIEYQEEISKFLGITSPYELDIKSFFSNRNTFGWILAMGLSLATINFFGSGRKLSKIMYLLLIGFLLINLGLTLSRGGFMFYLVFLAVYIVLYKGIRGLVFLTIIAVLMFGLLNTFLGSDFVESNIIRADRGSTGRDGIQEYGVQYFLSNNVWLGSGFIDPVNAVYDEFNYVSFHNGYVTVLASGGIILFTFYIALMLFTVNNAIKIYKKDRMIGASLFGLLVAYAIYNMIESSVLLQKGGIEGVILRLYILFIPLYLANYFIDKGSFWMKRRFVWKSRGNVS